MAKKKPAKADCRPERSISFFPTRLTAVMCAVVVRVRRMKYDNRRSCADISTELNLPLGLVEDISFYRLFPDWISGMSSFAAMQDLKRLGPERILYLAECCGLKPTDEQIQLFKDKRIHQMIGKLGDD